MTDQSPESSRAADPDRARRLFRYLGGEEWQQYRAILRILASTFFAEFTPADMASRLADDGVDIAEDIVAQRLEQLRNWGNITASASVGNPSSVADYYRMRNRYLITRAGQEVHDLAEGVLARVDLVTDLAPGRLDELARALEALVGVDLDVASSAEVGDLVRRVFDPHRAFTAELTQLFAELNLWQSRYDLDEEELAFFARVLVGYVAERLGEVERAARPIGRLLRALEPRFAQVAACSGGDLAERVAAAGLNVGVAHSAGSHIDDWRHLAAWFVDAPNAPARLERHRRDAVAAVRTLTANLTRLSRRALGASSRRADLLRLAGMLDAATSDLEVSHVITAAFGLHQPRHLGLEVEETGQHVPSTTPWAEGPRASVPVSLRARGDTKNRGQASPMTDRAAAQRLLRARRAAAAADQAEVDRQLVLVGDRWDDTVLDAPTLDRVQRLVGRAMPDLGVQGAASEWTDGVVRCRLRRTPGVPTTIHAEAGWLRFEGLHVEIGPADG